MEKENNKKIDIKRIISIIIAISIISCIIVISCYASVDTINLNTVYKYQYVESPSFMPAGGYREYSGTYIGKAYDENNNLIDVNITFTGIYTSSGSVTLGSANEINRATIYKSSLNNAVVKGKLSFTQIQNDASLNFFKLNLTEYNAMDDVYEESGNFLEWILNDTTTILGFMISNSVLLLVICIVIVSLSIGIIKRLTNKKF